MSSLNAFSSCRAQAHERLPCSSLAPNRNTRTLMHFNFSRKVHAEMSTSHVSFCSVQKPSKTFLCSTSFWELYCDKVTPCVQLDWSSQLKLSGLCLEQTKGSRRTSAHFELLFFKILTRKTKQSVKPPNFQCQLIDRCLSEIYLWDLSPHVHKERAIFSQTKLCRSPGDGASGWIQRWKSPRQVITDQMLKPFWRLSDVVDPVSIVHCKVNLTSNQSRLLSHSLKEKRFHQTTQSNVCFLVPQNNTFPSFQCLLSLSITVPTKSIWASLSTWNIGDKGQRCLNPILLLGSRRTARY